MQLKNKNSGKVLDVFGISTQNGANVVIWSNLEGDNQILKFTEIFPEDPGGQFGGQTFQLKFLHSSFCLDAFNTSPGSNVGQWGCHGNDNQKWTFNHQGNEYYQLVDVRDNLCLEGANGGTSDGTNIQVGSCNSVKDSLLFRACMFGKFLAKRKGSYRAKTEWQDTLQLHHGRAIDHADRLIMASQGSTEDNDCDDHANRDGSRA